MTECKRYLFLALALAAGLSIVACGGNSFTSTPPPVPADFNVSVQPGSVTVLQGGSSSPVSISIASLRNFNGNVAVAISGLPAGVTSSPAAPFQVGAGSSQSVVFSASNSATLGPVNLSFQATSGALSHSAGATMNVNPAPDFTLSVSPGQLSVTQGSVSAPATIHVSALNSFRGKVSLNVAGLPAGITTSPELPLQVDAGTEQQLTFTAAASAAPSTGNAVIQGTSGSLSHTASTSLQIQAALVADFSMGVDPNAVAVQQGSSQAVNLSINAINGFGDSVAVSISGLPSGVSASPASFNAAAGSKTAITFNAAKTAPAGSAVVTLKGADGSLNHTQTASMQILASTKPTYSVAYFDSSQFQGSLPDQSVRIVNPGAQSTKSTLGDLCANVYVFDSSQELKECCSCPVTANGFIRLSVNSNLTNNPGNGVAFNVGSVAIVPSVLSSSSPCDPTSVSPVPSLNVWGTHVAAKGTGFKLVETLAPSTALSGPELTELQSVCGFIVGNQSGAGICSCTTD